MVNEDFAQFTRNYPFVEENRFNVLLSTAENWWEQRRIKNANERKVFNLTFYPITLSEVNSIKAFYEARTGMYEQFKFTNPIDGIQYDVRFIDNSLKVERISYNTYKIEVSLITLTRVSILSVNIFDGINADEFVALLDIIVELGVIITAVSVSEDILIGLTPFDLSSYQIVSVNENISLNLLSYFDVYDDVNVTENVSLEVV